MTQSLVQTGAEISVSGGTSGSVTLNGVAAGNLLTACCMNESDAVHNFSAADGKNTWASAVQYGPNAGTGQAQILYAKNVQAGNTTVTITASGSIQFNALIQEWSGSDTAAPLAAVDKYDQPVEITQQQASLNGINPGSPCICLVCGGTHFINGGATAGGGYALTRLSDWGISEYQIFTNPPTNERGLWQSATNDDSVSVIAAFKAAGAAPARAGAFLDGGMGAMIAA